MALPSIPYPALRSVGSSRWSRGWTTIVPVLLVTGATALSPLQVDAESVSVSRARQLFREAESYYRVGAYEQALDEFQAALDLSPRPSILLNMAQCHRHLGHVEKALHFYKRYLSEWERLSPGVEASYRGEVEDHIATLAEELRESTEALRKNAEELRERHQPARVAADARVDKQPTAPLPKIQRVDPTALQLDHAPAEGSTAWLATGICTLTLAVGAEIVAIAATVIANDSSKGRGQSDRYTGMMIAGHALAGVLLITSGISWWLYYRSLRPRAEEPRTAFSVMPQRDGFALAMQLRF